MTIIVGAVLILMGLLADNRAPDPPSIYVRCCLVAAGAVALAYGLFE
jgi:high-affinity Fe2+/Pb2+ permease